MIKDIEYSTFTKFW